MALAAHLWTVATRLRRPPQAPPARPWSTEVSDPALGRVRLTGVLRQEPGARELLLFIHGITGCAEATYARCVAGVAAAAGVSCLRLNLRGCDRLGEDFYHGGLSSDLEAVLASPECSDYPAVYLLGYSLGGHLALRYAACGPDRRLRAVAAVCSPLDLTLSGRRFDQPAVWAYRRYVLANFREIYAAIAARRPVPVAPETAAKFVYLRQWDEEVVAPRWGFAGADDYHARASVAPHLGELAAPALLVAVEDDPMVPGEILRPVLARRGHDLEVRWVERGGHMAFPAALDLGYPGPPGLEGQLLGWLLSH
jgi:uncharacterized protein